MQHFAVTATHSRTGGTFLTGVEADSATDALVVFYDRMRKAGVPEATWLISAPVKLIPPRHYREGGGVGYL